MDDDDDEVRDAARAALGGSTTVAESRAQVEAHERLAGLAKTGDAVDAMWARRILAQRLVDAATDAPAAVFQARPLRNPDPDTAGSTRFAWRVFDRDVENEFVDGAHNATLAGRALRDCTTRGAGDADAVLTYAASLCAACARVALDDRNAHDPVDPRVRPALRAAAAAARAWGPLSTPELDRTAAELEHLLATHA
jgi:hypothetical protein